MRKLIKIFNSLHLPNWLVIVLLVVLFLRIPSFFEPYSYGDETTYLALGEGVRQGKVLYRDLFDHKPPLLYFTAALGGSLFWFKMLLAFWSFITIVIFWKLAERLFPQNKKLHMVATLIFALLTTIPLFEGQTANAENFMIGFTMLGFLILLTKELNFKNIYFAGVILAIATLFKIPAAFEVPAIIFYWLVTEGFKWKTIGKRTLYLSFGFLTPIALTFVWYAGRGIFQEYLVSAFLFNYSYISAFRPEDANKTFLVKNAPLIMRGLTVAGGIFLVWLFRKKLSKQFIFLTIWLLTALFGVTLPERPYPHYLLQITPSLAILSGMLFTLHTLEQSLVILPLAFAFLVPVYYKFWYYSSSAYYQRFLDFATGKSTKEVYLSNFGSHIVRSYKVAEFLMAATTNKDAVWVWGPESQTIYALSKRFPPFKYVANFHLTDLHSQEDIIKMLNSNPPKMIVTQPDAGDFLELSKFMEKNYLLINEIDGAKIYVRSKINNLEPNTVKTY